MTPVKDLGLVGFLPDQEGYEIPPNAFTDVKNVRMFRGWAEKCGGYQAVFSATSVVPYFVCQYSTATIDYIVHAGLAAVYVDDGTTRTDITGTAPTGAASNRWTGGAFNGLLILNNGVDSPMYWDGNTANNLVTFTGWTAGHKAHFVRSFKQFIIAGNVTKAGTKYPHMIKWSDSAEAGSMPGSWDETDPTNDAGESPALSETTDVIIDGLPLGDIFVIYKERSMYAMQLIGGNDIFRFFRLPGDSGILARGCVAATPKGHVVLTVGDVIIHNGQGPESLLDNKARKWLFDTMDPTNYEASFVTTHSAKQEVWVCFPGAGQSVCTKALVWNWGDGTLSMRELPNVTYAVNGVVDVSTSSWSTATGTWAAATATWSSITKYSVNDQRLFMSSTASAIYAADVVDSANGATVDAYVERTGLHFDAPDVRKLCRGIWAKIDGTTGSEVQIQIGAADDPNTAPTWQTAQTYTIGTSNKIDSFASGRYLAYRVKSNDVKSWRIRSFDFDVVQQGRY